ncbi:MAG: hypothetical protein ACXIVO_04980 [Glycocaulis sp.]
MNFFTCIRNAIDIAVKRESPQGKWVLVPRNTKSRHTANAIMKSAGLGAKF